MELLMPASHELLALSCAEMRRRIGTKEISPVDLVEASIARIEVLNPAVNAIAARDFARARKLAAAGSITTRGMARSSSATARAAAIRTSTAARDDAIGPITAIGFLRAQFEAELLANHPGEEAADRVLLPMGGTHNGGNRCSLPSAQHRQHASLFRTRPAFARGAGFGLRLARRLLVLSLLPRRNGALPAGGDDFDCRCFDFGSFGSRPNACLHR